MALFNTCLKTYLRQKRVFKDDKGRFFFAPNEDGTDRICKMPYGKPRTVAAKKGDAQNPFWVHYAAKIRFRRIGESLFLSIEPIFLFTTDGTLSVKGKNAGKLSLQWGGKQQNPDILRNLLFWGAVLANIKGEIAICTGNLKTIMVDSMPATSRMENGIAFDTIKMRALLEQADNVLNELAQNAEVDNDGDDDENNEVNSE